jgi:hypothetical protein
VTSAHQPFRADQTRALELDFRLVEQFQPASVEDVGDRHRAIVGDRLAFVLREELS